MYMIMTFFYNLLNVTLFSVDLSAMEGAASSIKDAAKSFCLLRYPNGQIALFFKEDGSGFAYYSSGNNSYKNNRVLLHTTYMYISYKRVYVCLLKYMREIDRNNRNKGGATHNNNNNNNSSSKSRRRSESYHCIDKHNFVWRFMFGQHHPSNTS